MLPEDPKWGVAKSQKICFFDETAMRHVANTSKGTSTGYEKSTAISARGALNFEAQLVRNDLFSGAQCDPHESRFEPFDRDPPISSTNK